MDGHHLGVHRQRRVGAMAATCSFEWNESLSLLLLLLLLLRRRMLLLLLRLVLLFLQLLLQVGNSRPVNSTIGDTAMLQTPAVVARTVVIVALADDLATTHNDTAMAVVERRLGGLIEAERQVVVGLHFHG